ncbi:hypothetical protein [Microbacterium sp.]|uniref:hypothetical protein n=1 Tax=Microbacterium sp. TaxID=51671 RepID=UPI00262BDE53|nr:hypothetical protein [Microbacterium sp.]
MTSDADEALSWEGDEDITSSKRSRPEKSARTEEPARPENRALPEGWNAVGKDSETIGRIAEDGTITEPGEPQPLSTPMLLFIGIVGGVYLLYTVGWIIGGLNLHGSAIFLIPEVMYQVAFWTAVLTPAIWFAAVWHLTRRSRAWVRVLAMIGGILLLIPWPFVMTGAGGA